MDGTLEVRVETTPNPNSLKLSTNRTLWQGRAQTFASPDEALTVPLAQTLLAIPGVKTVFFLRDFVTLNREPGAAWEPIAEQAVAALRAHFDQG
jgi:hypothetical protein